MILNRIVYLKSIPILLQIFMNIYEIPFFPIFSHRMNFSENKFRKKNFYFCFMKKKYRLEFSDAVFPITSILNIFMSRCRRFISYLFRSTVLLTSFSNTHIASWFNKPHHWVVLGLLIGFIIRRLKPPYVR